MEHVVLMGAEEVGSAGFAIRTAGENMNRAASAIDYAVTRFGDHIDRLERVIQNLTDALEQQ